MKQVRLIRLETNFIHGTFGVLLIDGQVFCVTLEPYDGFNTPNISCIPASQYVCIKVITPTFGKTFEVNNVPDRNRILFHAGNTKFHTKGCIILAEHYGKLMNDRAVLNSGDTFKKFLEIFSDDDNFFLTIKECY